MTKIKFNKNLGGALQSSLFNCGGPGQPPCNEESYIKYLESQNQMADGGELDSDPPKKKPIYVSDKNDPKYIAYQDSLTAYKYGEKEYKTFSKDRDLHNKYVKNKTTTQKASTDKKETQKLLKTPFSVYENPLAQDRRWQIGYEDSKAAIQDKGKLVKETNIKPISANSIKYTNVEQKPASILDVLGRITGVDTGRAENYNSYSGNSSYSRFKKPEQPVALSELRQKTVQPTLYQAPTQPLQIRNEKSIQQLTPAGIQSQQELPQGEELQQRNHAKTPKSYNVNSQRYNMQGENPYYDFNTENTDYETALRAKLSAENYNADVERRYGNKEALKNPKAVERLNQLRQEVNITPQFAMGGNLNNNNNMNKLTHINEGGLHSQNPLGGVPMGGNNTVEQGETKNGSFVYSNRITLTPEIIRQYNLPKSLIGKSVADATKLIDNKFKGRNDKISQSTKNGMLSKIAEAQEAMKPQEPEMEQAQEGMIDPIQMAFGGYVNRQMSGGGWYDQNNPYFMNNPGVQQPGIGLMNQIQPVSQLTQANSLSQIKPFSTGNQLPTSGAGNMSSMASMGANAAMPGMGEIIEGGKAVLGGIGNIAGSLMSKSKVDTSGIAPSAKVNSSGDVLKQGLVSAISNPSPSGMIKTLFSTGAGLITAGKDKKAALKNSNNFARRTNAQFSDQYALGGKINQMGVGGFAEDPFVEYSKRTLPQLNLQPINQVIPSFINKGTPINNTQAIIGTKVDGDFGKNSKLALDKYRQSKGMSNVGQPLSAADYTAMGLTSDGYKINKNAFRQQLPENLNLKLNSPTEGFNKYTDIENNVEAGKDKKSLVGKGLSYVNDNLGNLARYAPIAANAYQLANLKKPQGERLDRLSNRYKPEYVDEAQLQNIVNQTMNNTVGAISQSGASQGQTRASILGSQLQRTKALSDAYGQAAAQNRATNDSAQTFNLGVDQVNLQQSNSEKDINARNQGAYDTEKSKLIGKIGENIGSVGNEQAYKKIAITTTGYNWLAEYQKANPTATAEEAVTAAKKAGVLIDDKKTVKKQALGGYLIKNKVK